MEVAPLHYLRVRHVLGLHGTGLSGKLNSHCWLMRVLFFFTSVPLTARAVNAFSFPCSKRLSDITDSQAKLPPPAGAVVKFLSPSRQQLGG